jgi:hypothetical protein
MSGSFWRKSESAIIAEWQLAARQQLDEWASA